MLFVWFHFWARVKSKRTHSFYFGRDLVLGLSISCKIAELHNFVVSRGFLNDPLFVMVIQQLTNFLAMNLLLSLEGS